MNTAPAPERLVWAVETLAVTADQQVLEIGCGRGAALALVCEQLTTGSATGLDRSATMIDAAARRNAGHLASGRLRLQAAPLHRADLGSARFDTVFAVNVGVFWRGDPARELAVVREHLAPGGRLLLFHEPPPGSTGSPVPDAAGRLDASGFRVVATRSTRLSRTDVGCVVAEPAG